jgi:MFS family permease
MKHWRRAIYLMQTIEGLAGGLIGVFIPIYFLTLGYGLKDIFYFFIVNNFGILTLFFAAALFARRFGFAKTIGLRLLFLFANLFLLFNLKTYPAAFYLISILSAAEIAFYWFPLHVIFAKATDHEKVDEHVSNMMALPSLAKALLPFFGATISALFGFKALFVVAGVFYLASAVPLLFVGHIPVDVRIDGRKIIDYVKRFKRYFALETFLSIAGEVEGYLLPIFLFLLFKDIIAVGAVATYLSLGSALFTMVVGKFSNHGNGKLLLRAGALSMMLVWLARFVAETQTAFYLLSALAGFCGVLISIPFSSMIYRNAKDSHVEDFVIFREVPISLGRMLLYLLALLIVSNIKLSFLLAAASYLALIFI